MTTQETIDIIEAKRLAQHRTELQNCLELVRARRDLLAAVCAAHHAERRARLVFRLAVVAVLFAVLLGVI
ncbi:MAG: hypothetical protein H0W48_00485 [Methylibium sp.]|nr:hypothetical protein [Methylibium sp.]